VTIVKDGATRRVATVETPRFNYDAAADGVAAPFDVTVAQVSAAVGPGDEARITVHD
jgi:hypothetical protein